MLFRSGTAESGFDARMVLYNADGSRAEMSGNGVRCFAQAVSFRSGGVDALRILTDAGERLVQIARTSDPSIVMASVDMGEVAPLAEPHDWQRLGIDPMRPVSHLSLGNPHSVVATDDVAAIDLETLGRVVPHVNLEVVEAGPESHAVTMRVHERGAGITEACGTGACATAWASTRWGLVTPRDGEVLVHMDGGDAIVRLDQPTPGRVTLVGPSQYICSITVEVQ